ncbi:MAG: response regulator transcription factor [Akkermansiaceae bacterium]|nr:response regulator transcription factor [Akkermansiaceae bacterium]
MRILVIEDYLPILENVVASLTEEGYAVDASATGDEGLWYAENHNYDVIILDLMLPTINGITILSKIRKNGDNTPVIIISARDSVEARVDGLNAGADDYLIKPFSLRELIARVKSQTRKHYNQKAKVFTMDSLRIDFDAKRVFRDEKEIILTKREYGILEYLAHRPGEVVSRMDVWNHVYQENEDYASNAIDVYVGYLRKKLNKEGQANLIQTRRGQGYYLEAPSS